MLYWVKVERLEPSTLYTKYKVHTTRLGYLFIKLYFHHCTYPICIFIHESPNEWVVYHASHAMHVRQMAIMHHMHFMHCMHVLYPHMHCMHGGTYKKREMKWGKGIKGRIEIQYSNKLAILSGKCIISQGFKMEFWQKSSLILRSSIVKLVKYCIFNIHHILILYSRLLL